MPVVGNWPSSVDNDNKVTTRNNPVTGHLYHRDSTTIQVLLPYLITEAMYITSIWSLVLTYKLMDFVICIFYLKFHT